MGTHPIFESDFDCLTDMTAFLPPNLIALFAPRDRIEFKAPIGELPHEKDRSKNPYSGIASFVQEFDPHSETPAKVRVETRAEKEKKKRRDILERGMKKTEEALENWNPHEDPKAESDPFRTLFVARINYDTSQSKLKREFEEFGRIRHVRLVENTKTGKPRGYAFIEYDKERDMHGAYKYADGRKIDGKRVLVDVERGRTVKGWRPRRLGGGLGNSRRAPSPIRNEVDEIRRRGGFGFAGDEKRDAARERAKLLDKSKRESKKDDWDKDRSDRRKRSRSRDRKRDRRDRSRDRDRRRKDRDMADIKTDPGVKTDFDGGDFKSDPDRYVKAEKMDD